MLDDIMANKEYGMFMAVLAILAAVVIVQLLLLFQLSGSVSFIKGELGGGNQHSVNTSLSYLTITASGSAQAVPSKATLEVDFEGKGTTSYAATANLTSELNKANSTLIKYVNGNVSNIQTSYYNVYNQSSYYSTYNGYVATESVSITIPNINNVSAAIGAISAINGTSVYGGAGELSDAQMTSMRATALSGAIANATSQTQALLPGKNLSVSNITVNSYNRYPIYPLGVGVASPSAASTNKSLSPSYFTGTQTLTESITVVFQYKK